MTDQQRARAEEMVVKLAEYFGRMRAEGRRLVAVEQDVKVQIGRAVVTGRVDRLERAAGGGQYVVDLKTGKSTVPVGDLPEQPQLGVYQLAVEAGGFPGEPVSAGAELVMLGTGTVKLPDRRQPALSDAAEPGWAAELLAHVADGMAGSTFDAQQGPQCRRCPVRTSCPTQPEGRPVTS